MSILEVYRKAHNLKAAGSNPAPATPFFHGKWLIANDFIGEIF
jgi:hypothetical protein